MEIELARMAVVYLHLVACCVAIGLVFMSDLDMVKRLLVGDPGTLEAGHLTALHQTMVRALLVLWLTGVGLVAFDVWTGDSDVLTNPKLQSKFAVVVLLTINGALLHRFVLPMMMRAGALMRLNFGQRMVAVFAGSASGVSWFYAAMLGIGRPLNWKYSLSQIMAAYPLLILGGFVAMMLLTAWSQYLASGGPRVPAPVPSPAR